MLTEPATDLIIVQIKVSEATDDKMLKGWLKCCLPSATGTLRPYGPLTIGRQKTFPGTFLLLPGVHSEDSACRSSRKPRTGTARPASDQIEEDSSWAEKEVDQNIG